MNEVKVAQRLKQLRSEHNISYEKLSKALWKRYEIKISTDSLQNYENKPEKLPGMRAEYLWALADFYGVSADYILGFSADCARRNTSTAITFVLNQMIHLNSLLEQYIKEIERAIHGTP